VPKGDPLYFLGWRNNGLTGFHLDSKDEPDSFFLDRCGRGSGDSGEGELGLSVALSPEVWVGDAREDGEDRRKMYGGGGMGFGCSSRTGELISGTDVSSASDKSSKMARGGGRST
jgi:hypothetical protein